MSDKKSNGKRTAAMTKQGNRQQAAASRSAGSKRHISEVVYEDEEGTRDGKKRIKWNGELQAKFLQAVNKLGLFHGAVPSAILKEMGPHTGLTRENVASHLQLYRAHVVKDMLLSIDAPKSLPLPPTMAAPAMESLAPPPYPYTPTGYTGPAQSQSSLPPVPALQGYGRSASDMMMMETLSPSLIMAPPYTNHFDVYSFPSSYSYPTYPQLPQHTSVMRNQNSQQSSQNERTHETSSKEKLNSN